MASAFFSLNAAAESPAPRRSIGDALHVAGAGCFTSAELAAAVSSWLKRDWLDELIDFDVRVSERETIFVARRAGAVAGERRIPTATGTCPEITNAVALAIALAIDATVLDRIGAAAQPPPAPSPPAPSPLSASPAIAPEPVAAARLVRLSVEAFGAVSIDVLPAITAGAGGGLDASFGSHTDLRVTASYFGKSRTSLGDLGGALAVELASVRADGCFVAFRGRLVPRACFGIAAGLAFGGGRGFEPSFPARAAWVALTPRLDLRLAVTESFGLELGGEMFFVLVRPRFEVSRDGSVSSFERLPGVGGAITFGPVIIF